MTLNSAPNMDLPHSDSVVDAVKDLCESACGAVAEISKQDLSPQMVEGVVIAVVSIMGDVNWSVFIGLPRETSENIAKSFCGFEIPFDSEDMGDVVGELTNILAGNVKQILDKRGVNVEISLPSVFRAEGMEILIQRESTAKKIYFESQIGSFWTGVLAGKTTGIVA